MARRRWLSRMSRRMPPTVFSCDHPVWHRHLAEPVRQPHRFTDHDLGPAPAADPQDRLEDADPARHGGVQRNPHDQVARDPRGRNLKRRGGRSRWLAMLSANPAATEHRRAGVISNGPVFLPSHSADFRDDASGACPHAPPTPSPTIVFGSHTRSNVAASTSPDFSAASRSLSPCALAVSAMCAAFW